MGDVKHLLLKNKSKIEALNDLEQKIQDCFTKELNSNNSAVEMKTQKLMNIKTMLKDLEIVGNEEVQDIHWTEQ